MPVYLVRAFRWPRPAIRIHVIINNIDDASPHWVCAPACQIALEDNFHDIFPNIMSNIPKISFVEQYDHKIITGKEEDFAYVADTVHEIKLGADVDELRSQQIPYQQYEAFQQLRDQLAAGEKIAWYIVYCGDDERSYSVDTSISTPPTDTLSRVSGPSQPLTQATSIAPTDNSCSDGRPVTQGFAEQRARRGSMRSRFRTWFNGNAVKRTKSMKDLKASNASRSSIWRVRTDSPVPPLPLPLPGTAH